MSSPGKQSTQETGGSSSSTAGASRSLYPSIIGINNYDQSKAIRPPKAYQPKTDGDFKQWIRHLEHYFTLLNIDNSRKTTMLLYNLGEEASLTAYHLSLSDNSDYEITKTAVMQYFSPFETPEKPRTIFHQRFQNVDEALEHYAMTIRVLASKAYPKMDDNFVEKMAKHQFILGVRNPITRERLIVKRFEKLKDAIEFARLSEVAGFTAKCNPSKFSNAFVTVPITEDYSNYSNSIANSDFVENCNHVYARFDSVSEQPKAIPQQKLCFKCGLPGHIAKFCYSDKSLLNE